MELRFAFIGFGNVARAFARMLHANRGRFQGPSFPQWQTTAIATASHGCVISGPAGIDLNQAVDVCLKGGSLLELPGTSDAGDATSLIERCEADVIFETTPLNPEDGEPATGHIRSALNRGINVVTANKGPLAFAYNELQELAARQRVSFRFEGAVMDGTPIFNMVEHCLPAVRVLGFEGVLNSTTNHILTGMESGRSFDECLSEAQRLGIAEANADYDIDGWDAAVKAVALANVLMRADKHPGHVDRRGIRDITAAQLKAAADKDSAIRLVARADASSHGLTLRVAPESVSRSSPLGAAKGRSNVLVLRTDLMGEIAIFEIDPGVEQTAYALLSDLMSIQRTI